MNRASNMVNTTFILQLNVYLPDWHFLYVVQCPHDMLKTKFLLSPFFYNTYKLQNTRCQDEAISNLFMSFLDKCTMYYYIILYYYLMLKITCYKNLKLYFLLFLIKYSFDSNWNEKYYHQNITGLPLLLSNFFSGF